MPTILVEMKCGEIYTVVGEDKYMESLERRLRSWLQPDSTEPPMFVTISKGILVATSEIKSVTFQVDKE